MYEITRVPSVLREARLATGLTQRQVSETIGTSQSAVASLEGGNTNPTIDTLVRYATAIGVSLHVSIQPVSPTDSVVERYKADVDRASLRDNLRKSVDERLSTLAGWQEDLRKLQRATAQAKRVATKPAARAR